MSENNGEVQDVEVMPDLENEMIEEMPTPPPPSGGCGCNKSKNMAKTMPDSENKTNWMRIGLIVGIILVAYFMFKKGGKVEVPKVEVPKG